MRKVFAGVLALLLASNASGQTTLVSGVGTLPVGQGGTGLASAVAYALFAGGTTSTGAHQQVSGLGTSGYVLTSNGAGALPTWQAAAGGGVTSIAAGSGLAGGTVTSTGTFTLDLTSANVFTAAQSVNKAGIATTSTDALILTNTTAATSGVTQQYSSRIRLTGAAWKTNATAASQTDDWIIENQPQSGASATTENLIIASQISGGGYTTQATLTSSGNLTATGNITQNGNILNINSATPHFELNSLYYLDTRNTTTELYVGTANNGGSAGGGYNIGIGATALFNLNSNGFRNIALGGHQTLQTTTTGDDNIAIGDQALKNPASNNGNIAIGTVSGINLGSNSGASYNTAVGYSSFQTSQFPSYYIALGAYAGYSTDPANNSMEVGGNQAAGEGVKDMYCGDGVAQVSGTVPDNFTLHASGGAGTNIAGASLTLAGGIATGNSTSGPIIFKSAVAGATGTTAQTLAEEARIDTNGINVSTGKVYRVNATTVLSSAQVLGGPNTSQASPSNPTGTNSATALMMGLAGSITPSKSLVCVIIVTGDLNSGTTGNPTVQLYTGTGSAPANGAALTGTAIGSALQEVGIAGGSVPFCCTAIVTLTNAATWIDCSLKSDGTSTATLTNVSISAYELK